MTNEDEDDILQPQETTPVEPAGENIPDTTDEANDILAQESVPVEDQESDDELDPDFTAAPIVGALDDELTVRYDQSTINMLGTSRDKLRGMLNAEVDRLGGPATDARVMEVGTWHNLVYRALDDESQEDIRIQEALSNLNPEDRQEMSSVLRDSETGKILLRIAQIVQRNGQPGIKRHVTGDEALMMFESLKSTKGGGYRIPLYNSGICVDVVVPTGNDLQTMITNCLLMDNELGSSQGAHYFAYYDLLYKTQILNFIKPLIVNSSYVDWRKKGKLWQVIKLPDLPALIMAIAAICYKDGFENFTTPCTNEGTKENPNPCQHVETFTADLFKMIVTRWAVLSKESVEFMVQSRAHAARNTLTQIMAYQAGLGIEGERITFNDLTFVMRIPTLAEYQEAGNAFISDIINEIQADNTDGQYTQFGFRYMRVFLPWVGSVEGEGSNQETFITSDPAIIQRMFEKLDREDDDGEVRKKIRDFINRAQLTYVGHPAVPCPKCNHVTDTPSGMITFDPFSAFFTLALLYTRPSE